MLVLDSEKECCDFLNSVISDKKSSIRNVKFGKNVTIIEPVNLYECSIADNCFIGPFVEIQKNLVIKQNTRIQSHYFIVNSSS